MSPTVLFWSQNPDLYLLFSHILAMEGYRTAIVDDEELVEHGSRASTLAVLLDTENHIDRAVRVCATIKRNKATAHVRLLALVPTGSESDYLNLLKAGVDECFIRPISPSRILACLQGYATGVPRHVAAIRDRTFKIWELSLDTGRRLVKHGAEELQLGPIEFKLLCRLLEAPGRVFSRSELIEAAWPPNHYVQPRTVDVHVGRLRRSLARLSGRDIIRTVRSTGYAAEFG
jgi:two-component system, OmpR family, phosphate regulon response regulator PhoB